MRDMFRTQHGHISKSSVIGRYTFGCDDI